MAMLLSLCLFFIIFAQARDVAAQRMQSPIALNTKAVVFSPGYLIANYRRSQAFISNLSEKERELTVDFSKYNAGELFTARKPPYYLRNIHIHMPSEHTLNGKRFDMEVHIVHEAVDRTLLVVGLLYDQSTGAREDPFFSELEYYLPELIKEDATIAVSGISPSALNVPDEAYFAYNGSLTTPPYSEGVSWHVHYMPRFLPPYQYATLKAALKGTNEREIQPLNGRTVRFIQLVTTALQENGRSSM